MIKRRKSMTNQIETSLIIRKESIYDRMRKHLFYLIYGKDYPIIQRLDELMKPKRPKKNTIIIPKEMRKDIAKP